jgi:periplasmic divalent cation tolerance protein
MKYYAVLVTTPDRKTSERLSKGLVQNKLAACVNIVPGLRSRYRWKGNIETAREELLIIKTARKRLSHLTQWVRKNHPYTICEVIALPVAAGNKDYLRWIAESVN